MLWDKLEGIHSLNYKKRGCNRRC